MAETSKAQTWGRWWVGGGGGGGDVLKKSGVHSLEGRHVVVAGGVNKPPDARV